MRFPNPFADGKIFGHEPTLFIAAITSLIMVAGTLGFSLLSADQAAVWVLLINAVAAAVNAATVRPISPVAFTYAIGVLIALGAQYGFEIPEDTIFMINAAVIPILALLSRGQVTPKETAVSSTTTAGAAPDVQTVPEG